MKPFVYSLLLFLLLGFGCHTEKSKSNVVEAIIGIRCGWCGGTDSLSSTEFTSNFVLTDLCEEENNHSLSEDTRSAYWQELLSTYDKFEFFSLDYNTCDICVDGCDYFIRIKDEKDSHLVVYTSRSIVENEYLSNLHTLMWSEFEAYKKRFIPREE